MSTARTAALLLGAFIVGCVVGYDAGVRDGVRAVIKEPPIWRIKPRRRF